MVSVYEEMTTKPWDKEYCKLCGKKVECLGQPGCDYWAQFLDWHAFHEGLKRDNKIFWITWIGLVIIAICLVSLAIGN
jgi:hypothetical protein